MSTSLLACSRTTGGPTIRAAILGFLEAYPTPSAVLEAHDEELEICIGPLGLQEVRRKALQRMSHEFFAKVPQNASRVSPHPHMPMEERAAKGTLVHGRDGLYHAPAYRWGRMHPLVLCMQRHCLLLMSWGPVSGDCCRVLRAGMGGSQRVLRLRQVCFRQLEDLLPRPGFCQGSGGRHSEALPALVEHWETG